MTSIYYCSECDCYLLEDELEEKCIDLENFYGVGNEFENHTKEWHKSCPQCGSIEVEAVEDYDIVDMLNRLAEKEKRK